jgi:hypothetical protein
MTIRVTVGETGQPADPRNLRGTVTATLVQQADGQPVFAVSAEIMGTSCSVRLTIDEVARLRDALDSMIERARTP